MLPILTDAPSTLSEANRVEKLSMLNRGKQSSIICFRPSALVEAGDSTAKNRISGIPVN